MTPDLEQDPLAAELATLMEGGAVRTLEDAEFDRLARAVFAAQFEACAPYQRYCERRERTPESVRHWLEIPAVPVLAFKEIEISSDPDPVVRAFHTSGTTRTTSGKHLLSARALELYRASMLPTFRRFLLPEVDQQDLHGRTTLLSIALAPSEEEAPQSSLSFMIDGVCLALCVEPPIHVFGAAGLDEDGLDRALARAEREGRPAVLLGTSLAFLAAVERLEARKRRYFLPTGSRAMETGGAKGTQQTIEPETLRHRMAKALGLEESSIVNEYGMTEACSQFYDASLLRRFEEYEASCALAEPQESERARLKHGPPWARAVVCDPETLEPSVPGKAGVLRIVDLANRFTLSFLQTEDLAVASELGGPFRLIGRAEGAEARGCSLAAEEWLRATERAAR